MEAVFHCIDHSGHGQIEIFQALIAGCDSVRQCLVLRLHNSLPHRPLVYRMRLGDVHEQKLH